MNEIVFFLEEPSTKEMLEGLLPRIASLNVKITYLVFEGKSDLEKRVERKLRAYNNPNAIFFIMRDQDSGDCIKIKNNLVEKCKASGKRFIIRILCHELESWYLADLQAVERALNKNGLSKQQSLSKFRLPDLLANAKQELRKIVPEYEEVAGSREIGKFLDFTNNRSKSFSIFIQSFQKLVIENS